MPRRKQIFQLSTCKRGLCVMSWTPKQIGWEQSNFLRCYPLWLGRTTDDHSPPRENLPDQAFWAPFVKRKWRRKFESCVRDDRNKSPRCMRRQQTATSNCTSYSCVDCTSLCPAPCLWYSSWAKTDWGVEGILRQRCVATSRSLHLSLKVAHADGFATCCHRSN